MNNHKEFYINNIKIDIMLVSKKLMEREILEQTNVNSSPFGVSFLKDNLIYIRDDLNRALIEKTIFHELIHFYLFFKHSMMMNKNINNEDLIRFISDNIDDLSQIKMDISDLMIDFN